MRVQTAPPKAVRVKHVKDNLGHWHDQLLPARELTPEQQTRILTAMHQRCASASALV